MKNKKVPVPHSEPKKVEEVLGVTKSNDQLLYIVKWEGIDKPEVISREIASKMYPQDVIRFYEKKFFG